jgi:hypothetical protein
MTTQDTGQQFVEDAPAATIGAIESGAVWTNQIILGVDDLVDVKIVSVGDTVIAGRGVVSPMAAGRGATAAYNVVAIRGLIEIGVSRWYVQAVVATHVEWSQWDTRPVWMILSKKFD